MTTATILLLLVAAASTFAFSPPEGFTGARRRRDVSSGTQAGSGAVSFASSSSSGSGTGTGYGVSSRSGFADSGQGLNSVNSGGYGGYSGSGDFSYPNYANPYPGGAGYVPVDFNSLFMQYLDFMQRMAQQQAYAPNFYVPDQNNFDNTVTAGFNDGDAPGFSGISTRSGAGDFGFGAPQNGFYFPGQNGYSGSNSGDGQVSASAGASLSPRGGFGYASISPPPQGNPELATRMGSVPASGGGGNFAVFSSSQSSSSDVNGVRKTSKEATSVINDNGKVTTFHVSDR